MGKVLRSVLAVFAGVFVGFILVGCIEMANFVLYPPPPGLKMDDPGALEGYIHGLPSGAFVVLIVGWSVGVFAGSWVAARVARGAKLVHGLVVGVLFLLATLHSLVSIPHPVWVWVLGLTCTPVASCLGARLASPRPPAGKPEPVDALV